jgi:hypothetical protein
MDTETAGWKWVARSVVEAAIVLVGLGLFGPLTLSLLGG